MRVTINDKEIIFPSSLSEITLGQRIDFHEKHGKLLDQMLESTLKMEDEIFRELELTQFQMEKMFTTFAFFAGTTPEAVKESEFVGEVAAVYNSCLAVLFEEEENIEPQKDFTWKGEQWEISSPSLSQGSDMKFGEIIDAKQMVKDMVELGRSNWEALQKLSAVFFRKKGEQYKEEFLYEDSDRLKLMLDLPMDIALQVGFFLSVLTNSLVNTSLSFKNQGPSKPGAIRRSILKRMAG